MSHSHLPLLSPPSDPDLPLDRDARRRTSIDSVLELERQLEESESESAPNHATVQRYHWHTPSKPSSPTSSTKSKSKSPHSPSRPKPQNPHLDPDVLSAIVVQQRASLAELTQERDELAAALAKSHLAQSSLQALATELSASLDTERDLRVAAEGQLAEARIKAESDAESISMLRAKVEEARRGVMRLQTESRRASTFQPLPLALDLSSASTASGRFSTFNKRASIISTGGGGGGTTSGAPTPRSPTFLSHRRVSSLSDPCLTPDSDTDSLVPRTASTPYGPILNVPTPTTPTADVLPTTSTSSTNAPLLPAAAILSPPIEVHPPAPEPPLPDPRDTELEDVRKEMTKLRRELKEAREAREASEICLRALRDFMESGGKEGEGSGKQMLKLPPLPTDEVVEEEAEPVPAAEEKKAGGWGIKLWRTSSSAPASASVTSRKVSPSEPPPVGPSISEPVHPSAGAGSRLSSASSARPDMGDRRDSGMSAGSASSAGTGTGTAAPTPPAKPPSRRKFSLFGSTTPAPAPAPLPELPTIEPEPALEEEEGGGDSAQSSIVSSGGPMSPPESVVVMPDVPGEGDHEKGVGEERDGEGMVEIPV